MACAGSVSSVWQSMRLLISGSRVRSPHRASWHGVKAARSLVAREARGQYPLSGPILHARCYGCIGQYWSGPWFDSGCVVPFGGVSERSKECDSKSHGHCARVGSNPTATARPRSVTVARPIEGRKALVQLQAWAFFPHCWCNSSTAAFQAVGLGAIPRRCIDAGMAEWSRQTS